MNTFQLLIIASGLCVGATGFGAALAAVLIQIGWL